MAQLITWPNLEVAKRRLAGRLKAAKESRKRLCETQFLRNERYIYKNDAALAYGLNPHLFASGGGDTEDFDDPEFVEIAYAFKDLRYLHAELSSNPPVVQATPLSADLDARGAARAGDQAAQHIRVKYEIQEVYDLVGLDTMIYGTGIGKAVHDPELGTVVGFDKKTQTITMSGDLYAGRVSPWDFYPDPASTGRLHFDWAFEKFRIKRDAFLSRWPECASLLAERTKDGLSTESPVRVATAGNHSSLDPYTMDAAATEEVELYEYWETGLPENGMLGRYAVCFDDGTLVCAPRPSPLAVPEPLTLAERRAARARGRGGKMRAPKRRIPRAVLPYQVWTDIDVPGRLWGKSFLEYAGPNQELMNNLDSALLELVKTHGIFRLLLPPGAELQDNQIENDAARVYRMKSGSVEGQQPQMLAPAGVPGCMQEIRGFVRQGIDDLAGVNENNFGSQSREISGFGMQYAVNQSRVIRRRLFNKSVAFTHGMYDLLLRLACYHWDDPEMVEVLGKERAFDSVELRGIEFDGGYRLEVKYGTTLPIDPEMARDQLVKFWPMLKDAQIPPDQLLKALRFGDFNQLRSAKDLAEDRQKEVFDEIIATGMQVPPEKHQDHENMLAWAKYYRMTAEFVYLPEDVRALIDEHLDLRAQAAASERPLPPDAGAIAPGTPTPSIVPPGMPPGAPPGAAGPAPASPTQGPPLPQAGGMVQGTPAPAA